MVTFQEILWAIFIGVAIGAVYTFYIKQVLGGLVRKLLQNDAFDADSALTFDELGIKGNPFLKYSLRDGSVFSETVKHEENRYFIPEDRLDLAESKYGGDSVSIIILFAIIGSLFLAALICSYAFPQLFSMLGGLST